MYIKNQSSQNMLIVKVNPPFLYSSMEKNRKDSADFCEVQVRSFHSILHVFLYTRENTRNVHSIIILLSKEEPSLKSLFCRHVSR